MTRFKFKLNHITIYESPAIIYFFLNNQEFQPHFV